MKKKLLLFSLMIVSLFCLLAISVSAYNIDTTRTVTLENGTSVNLYAKDDEDQKTYALTWYLDGTELKSMYTKNAFKWSDSGWIEANEIDISKVVVVNFQCSEFDLGAKGSSGFNLTFRNSENIEYIFMSDEVTQFNEWYAFSECSKLKICDFTVNSKLKSFKQYMFHKSPKLQEIFIPAAVTSLPGGDSSIGMFSQCVSLEKVTFGSNENLKSIGDAAFNGATALEEIVIPDSVTSVGLNAFRATSIVNSVFTENSKCESWGKFIFRDCDSLKNMIIPANLATANQESNYGPFSECDGIDSITFAPNFKAKTLPQAFFSKATIRSITLPEGLEYLNSHTFNECKGLTEISLPNSLIYAEERVFQSCSDLQIIRLGNSFQYFTNTGTDHQSFTYLCPSLKYVYIPASFYKNTDIAYKLTYAFNGGSNVKFFFTGTEQEIKDVIDKFNNTTDYSVTEGNSKFLSASLVSADVYLANPENYEKGNYIVYGYSACDAFYNGVHTDTDKDCTTKDICTRCQDVSCDAHEATVVITYTDYAQKGTKSVSCAYDNCNGKSTEEVDAIFTPDGYSVKEDGKALLGGYSINTDALKAYNAYLKANGKAALKFGIIMSNASNFTIVDGEYKGGKGLIVEATNDSYSTVKYVISGYKAENALVNLELVITLYVIDEKGMSFIQADSSAALGKTDDNDNATCNGSAVTLDKISLASVSQATLESGKVEAGSSYETALKEIVALIPTEATFVNKED